MNKLLSANFFRLRKNKCFRGSLAFMFVIGIASPLLRYRDMKQSGYINNLDNGFFMCALFIGIILAVFCSLFIGTEHNDGTIRNKIIVGQKRETIYLSNMVTCSIIAITMCIVFFVPYLSVGIPLLGFFVADMKMIVMIGIRKLRAERRKFQKGDIELKNAVTNVSHDLRTPLTAIYGYLDLLEQEEKSEKVNRYIAVIKNRTEMLKQLTEELFRYSVILTSEEDLKIEPITINNVLEESIASFYTILKEKQISPKIIIPQKKIVRNLDRSALSRIFANLLNNVVKYSNGDLEVTLFENGEIHFINHASNLTEIEVGKLFDRFYTVNNARNSTGLGLSISKALVEKMNGTISAEYNNEMLNICIVFDL